MLTESTELWGVAVGPEMYSSVLRVPPYAGQCSVGVSASARYYVYDCYVMARKCIWVVGPRFPGV